MGNKTFTIIKPNAVANGHTGKILDMIIEGGFTIRAMKMMFMSRNQAEKFYAVHKGREFFNNLMIFMTSGPIIVAILERENAVEEFRRLVGNTNPQKADEGTIRRRFADSLTRNSIHASDSDENAREEWSHFFGDDEIMCADYFLPIPTDQLDSK